jgi:hypothetical protein
MSSWVIIKIKGRKMKLFCIDEGGDGPNGIAAINRLLRRTLQGSVILLSD